MDDHLSRVRCLSVFPNIDPLPGSQTKPPASDGNREIHRGQRRPHMGRHIVSTFRRVVEQAVSIRNEPLEETLKIQPYFRVGVLLD